MAMILRSVYLDPGLDSDLAARAQDEGTTKAELMRRFLVEGLSRPTAMLSGYAVPETSSAPIRAARAVASTKPTRANGSSRKAAGRL